MRDRITRPSALAAGALACAAALCAPLMGAAWVEVGPAGAVMASAISTPTASLTTTTAAPGLAGWARGDVTATIAAASFTGTPSVAYAFSEAGAMTTVSAETTSFRVAVEGTTTVWFRAIDTTTPPSAEETVVIGPTGSGAIRIDKSAPAVSVDATSSYANTATVAISVVDTHSGPASISYRLDNGATQTVAGALASVGPIHALGAHSLRVWAVDVAGNASPETSRTFSIIDTQAPVSTIGTIPAGWSSTDVTVSITATDTNGSGIAKISYWLKRPGAAVPGIEVTYTAPGIPVSDQGTTTVYYRSRDVSGNVEATKTVEVRIDKAGPTGPASLGFASLTDTSARLVWPAAADALSGVARYEVLSGASVVATTTGLSATLATLTPDTTYTLGVRAVDVAGNVGPVGPPLIIRTASGSTIATVSAGTGVSATLQTPPGGLTGTRQAGVGFSTVTTGGALKLVRFTPAQRPAAPPPGYRFLGDDYDFSFGGAFSGTATVTFPYDPRIPSARAHALVLLHWDGSLWRVVPSSSVDTTASTVSFGLSSFSPMSIAEPDSTNTTATLTPGSNTYFPTYGAAVTVAVRLADASATPLPGFTVVLERFSGGVWSPVATMTPVAGSPGDYAAAARAVGGVRTAFRASLVGGDGLYLAAPAEFRVTPKARLSAPRPSATGVRRGATLYLSGSMLPRRAMTARMLVYRWNPTRRAWVYGTYRPVRISNAGTYRASVRLARTGTYRFRLRVGDDTGTAMIARTYGPYSAKVRVR